MCCSKAIRKEAVNELTSSVGSKQEEASILKLSNLQQKNAIMTDSRQEYQVLSHRTNIENA